MARESRRRVIYILLMCMSPPSPLGRLVRHDKRKRKSRRRGSRQPHDGRDVSVGRWSQFDGQRRRRRVGVRGLRRPVWGRFGRLPSRRRPRPGSPPSVAGIFPLVAPALPHVQLTQRDQPAHEHLAVVRVGENHAEAPQAAIAGGIGIVRGDALALGRVWWADGGFHEGWKGRGSGCWGGRRKGGGRGR